jgi:hypothetical protein
VYGRLVPSIHDGGIFEERTAAEISQVFVVIALLPTGFARDSMHAGGLYEVWPNKALHKDPTRAQQF